MGFHLDTNVKAVRKRHICDGCGQHIEIGQPATRWAGLSDGDFCTAIYHPDCRDAEVAMNFDILGYQYRDDWWPLSEIEREDRPWLAGAYPAVAARLGIATPPEQPTPAVPVADYESRKPRSVEDAEHLK